MDRAEISAERTGFWGQAVLWLCRSLLLAGYQCSEHSVPLDIYCDSLSVLRPVGVLSRHFSGIRVLVFNTFRLYSGWDNDLGILSPVPSPQWHQVTVQVSCWADFVLLGRTRPQHPQFCPTYCIFLIKKSIFLKLKATAKQPVQLLTPHFVVFNQLWNIWVHSAETPTWADFFPHLLISPTPIVPGESWGRLSWRYVGLNQCLTEITQMSPLSWIKLWSLVEFRAR